MAGATLKIEGTEVAPGGSGCTVVNITLRQESGMAYLCKGAASLVRSRAAAKEATKAPPARRPCGGEQAALGGAQILLGAVCIGLGVVLSVAPTLMDTENYYYDRALRHRVVFWMGSLFILSGAFSMVGAQCSGNWVHLATFLNLGSVVAGSVALTLGLTNFLSPTHQPDLVERLCKHRAEYQGSRSWEMTTRPLYDDQRDQEGARQCQAVLWW